MKWFLTLTTLLTSVLVLTACTAATVEPVTPTAEPSDIPPPLSSTSTATATPGNEPTTLPTSTPTVTPEFVFPTASPVLPTLSAPIVNDFESFLFNDGADLDCPLPCWHGLRVGKSGRDDVQRVFDDLFGLNGELELFPDNIEESPFHPGFYVVRPSLETYQPISLGLIPSFWLSIDTNTLERLSVNFSEAEEIDIPMEHVLERMGEPDHMFVGIETTSSPDASLLFLLEIYDEGMVFFYGGFIQRRHINDSSGDNQYVSDYCLGQRLGWNKEFLIFEPFANGLDDLTPIQASFIHPTIEDYGLVLPEELLSVDKAEITRRAVHEENPCFEIPSDSE